MTNIAKNCQLSHNRQMDELTSKIFSAMQKIKRQDFVVPEMKGLANFDQALPIPAGQTISQPTTVSFMIHLLEPEPGNKILDLGSGSGWTTALLAELVRPKGKVVGIERVSELVEFGKHNLGKYHLKNAEIREAGKVLGLPEEAPFDRIMVSASATKLPEELIDQLADGGLMVIPIKDTLVQIKKAGGKFTKQEFPGFAFVPLIE